MSEIQSYWRKCGVCKKEIPYGGIYQVCSVSTCRKHVYCSVDCWDVHLPLMNHKSAWAEENRAPSKPSVGDKSMEDSNNDSQLAPGKRRIVVSGPKGEGQSTTSRSELPQDVLIVASKLKNYVKARGELNTSSNVMDRLSDIVRDLCDKAIERAKSEGRKTLMDRDF